MDRPLAAVQMQGILYERKAGGKFPGPCLMAVFAISSGKPSGSADTVLVLTKFVAYLKAH